MQQTARLQKFARNGVWDRQSVLEIFHLDAVFIS